MEITNWLRDNYIEVFGALAGIIYVLLEIRQNIWLWPLGIMTSAVYIWVFFTSKFYADMSLQVYYLFISVLGWYWWVKGKMRDYGAEMREELKVSRLNRKTGIALAFVFVSLYGIMWLVLSRLTDSPVPEWDSFITSLSVVATWMLARKIFEHWYLWVVVNSVSTVIFLMRGLYPTMALYAVYGMMSFVGMIEWRKSMMHNTTQ